MWSPTRTFALLLILVALAASRPAELLRGLFILGLAMAKIFGA